MTSADLNIILPELILALFAMGGLMVAVYTGKDRMAGLLTWASAALMAALAGYIA